jgi:hypothetical protein
LYVGLYVVYKLNMWLKLTYVVEVEVEVRVLWEYVRVLGE